MATCKSPNSAIGDKCYAPCPVGTEPNPADGTLCVQTCPLGFTPSGLSCIRPSVHRDEKPPLKCPENASRVAETCLLECPPYTVADYEVCVPVCPNGFEESEDGLSCIADTVRRTSTKRASCYPNEERIGDSCFAPCTSNMIPYELDPSFCRFIVPREQKPLFQEQQFIASKLIIGRGQVNTTCDKGYSPSPNGLSTNTCMSACKPNQDADHSLCILQCPANMVPQGFTSCARGISPRGLASGGTSWALVIGIIVGVVILLVLGISAMAYFFGSGKPKAE